MLDQLDGAAIEHHAPAFFQSSIFGIRQLYILDDRAETLR
jgi:hypothetical protein